MVSKVYIFCHPGFLLSVKSFNKIFNGGSPAFSSVNLKKPLACSTSIPIAGCPLRCFQIFPLDWIPCLNLKEDRA